MCNLPVYLENNKDKINYSVYRFVGSETIISSNKVVVHLRTKQACMRLSIYKANYLITFSCMYESDNWNKVEKIIVNNIIIILYLLISLLIVIYYYHEHI